MFVNPPSYHLEIYLVAPEQWEKYGCARYYALTFLLWSHSSINMLSVLTASWIKLFMRCGFLKIVMMDCLRCLSYQCYQSLDSQAASWICSQLSRSCINTSVKLIQKRRRVLSIL